MTATAAHRAAPSFAEWLLRTPEFPHLHPADVQAHLQRLQSIRQDLVARRGEPHHLISASDVAHVVDGAGTHAELVAQDRLVIAREWCWSWLAYLGYLDATDRWAGSRQDLDSVRAALLEQATRTRGRLLDAGAHTAHVTPLAELRRLRRTRLVQDAEDVLRGRVIGTSRLRALLVRAGYLNPDGGRGPHRRSWDAADETTAARARRRLVVDGLVTVLADDPEGAATLALVTSARPADVTAGTRQLERLVTTGRLTPLVAAGVLPAAAPWRINPALQHAVHVALTRLDDAGLLAGVPDSPREATQVRAG